MVRQAHHERCFLSNLSTSARPELVEGERQMSFLSPGQLSGYPSKLLLSGKISSPFFLSNLSLQDRAYRDTVRLQDRVNQ
jgi:hypothetical protein